MTMFVLLTLLYFLPTIVATQRGHRAGGIIVLNLLLGWTGIGWLVLTVWALASRPPWYYDPAFHPGYGLRRY